MKDINILNTILKDLQKLNEKKKLSPKQKKIAQAAPPPDVITGADFKALNKNEGNPAQYDAPTGSKRARQIAMTKADLASGDPERKARAYRRRDRKKMKQGQFELTRILFVNTLRNWSKNKNYTKRLKKFMKLKMQKKISGRFWNYQKLTI